MSNSIEFQLEKFNKQIPDIFEDMTWKVIKKNVGVKVVDDCSKYQNSYPIQAKKKGLYIIQKASGSGKTSVAISIVDSIIKSGKTNRFSVYKLFIEFMEELRVLILNGGSIEQSPFYIKMMKADLIILDDIGLEILTESMVTRYYYILEKLWGAKKHVIMTSKYAIGELIDRAAENVPTESIESVASRISGLCKVIELKNNKDSRV